MDPIEQELRQIKEDLAPKQPTDDQVRKALGLETEENQTDRPSLVQPQDSTESAITPPPPRTPLEQLRDTLLFFDAKYLSWMDSWIGKGVVIAVILAIVYWAMVPTTQERQQIYQQGVCDAQEANNQPCE